MRIILFTIALLGVASCTNTQNEQSDIDYFENFNNTYTLKGRTININNEFKTPWNLQKFNDYILINDHSNEEGMISILSLDDYTYFGQSIKKGIGPEEFLNVGNILETEDPKIGLVYEIETRRYARFNIDSLIRNKNSSLTQKIKLNNFSEIEVNNIYQLNNSKYISTNLPSYSGRFSIFSKDLTPKLIFGEDHFLENKAGVSKDQHNYMGLANLYSSEISSTKKGDKIVVAHLKVDLIDIYDLTSNKKIKSLVGHGSVYPPESITYDDGFASPCFDCSRGYSSATEKSFFVLYRYKKWSDPDGWLSNIIYQFDWEGNPQNKLILDQEISDFIINEKGNKIIALNPNSNTPLIEYEFAME